MLDAPLDVAGDAPLCWTWLDGGAVLDAPPLPNIAQSVLAGAALRDAPLADLPRNVTKLARMSAVYELYKSHTEAEGRGPRLN